jgi:hypothetical protein
MIATLRCYKIWLRGEVHGGCAIAKGFDVMCCAVLCCDGDGDSVVGEDILYCSVLFCTDWVMIQCTVLY